MATGKHYRSWILAAAVALLALPGCESLTKSKIKEEQTSNWNLARLGVIYQLAQQQYQVGDYEKCEETLAKALAVKEPHAGLRILAAQVDIEKGRLESASAHLKAATQQDAANPEPYYLLGVVYQRWQNNQAAHDYYKLAYDKKPTQALYLLAVAEMKLAIGQYEEAQRLLEEKLVYFEQTAAVRVALGKVHALKGEYAEAAKSYREATLLSPDDLNIRQNYAESLFFAGRPGDALPVLEDLKSNANLTEQSSVQMLLGQCYMKVHRTRDARTCFAEITRGHPNDMAAWLCLGKATLELDDAAQAQAVAQRVLKVEPENVPALVLMALAQQRQKAYDGAQLTLERAKTLAPTSSTVLCLLGINAQRLGRGEQAGEYFGKAIEANPQDPWAQELLAAIKPPDETNR